MNPKTERHNISNGLRIAGGVGCFLLLIGIASRIDSMSHVVLYVASWVTFLHLCIGVFVLVRYLHAYGRSQQVLDIVATTLLAGGLITFTHPAFWCSFFAALVAVAVLKYILLYQNLQDPVLKRYVRDKLVLEGPAAVLLALAAVIFAFGDLPGWIRLGIQTVILAGTTAFFIWMTFIRRRYHQIRQHIHQQTDTE